MASFSTVRLRAVRFSLLFALVTSLSPVAALRAEGPAPAAPNALPDWLQKAMAREARKVPASRVEVGDGFFESRLVGELTSKPQEVDGGWYMLSNIGTAAPIECWVFTDPVDLATLAANIAEASMQSAAQLNGRLGERSIYHVDAGAYGAAPYLALEWFYTVGEPPQARVGLSKVRVALQDEVTLACGHNDAGYRETFAKAFEGFVRGARFDKGTPAHYYEEVVVQKIGSQPIGIARSTFTRDDEGDSEINVVESALIPVDGSTLSTTDTWRSGFSRPDGTLINQSVATSENGELTMQLSLAPMEDGSWYVSGTYHGKTIERELEAGARPVSEIGQMMAVQQLFNDVERDDVAMDVWIPQADPTQFLSAGVAMAADGRAEGLGQLTLGPMSIDAEFDPSGSLRSGHMQAGVMSVELDRVWVEGTPP